MPLALLAAVALTLAACSDTSSSYSSSYTSTTSDPVDYRQQELDKAIEESLEGVDTSELSALEEA